MEVYKVKNAFSYEKCFTPFNMGNLNCLRKIAFNFRFAFVGNNITQFNDIKHTKKMKLTPNM